LVVLHEKKLKSANIDRAPVVPVGELLLAAKRSPVGDILVHRIIR
jgi:hypothetical protein